MVSDKQRQNHGTATIADREHGPLENVLILAYWFPPSTWSGAFRPLRFQRYLPDNGYKAHVIAGSAEPGAISTPDVSRVPDPSNTKSGPWLAAGLLRTMERALPYRQELDWLPHAVARAEQLLARGSYSAILSTSPPNATHLVALLLKKRHGIRWIADFRDPIYGNPFHESRYAIAFDRWIERWIATNADVLVANTDTALQALTARYPKAAARTHVIWNSYDPDNPVVPAPLPARPYKVLGHFGSLYGGRHPLALIHSLKRLFAARAMDPSQVRLQLTGWIDMNDSWVKECDLPALAQQGWLEFTTATIPRPAAQKQMAESDCLLLLDLNSRETVTQVPAKLFEYVQVGRPILAFTTKGSPTDRILAQCGIAHVCIYAEMTPAETDAAIARFFQLPVAVSQPTEWYQEQFDPLRQTRRLAALLRSAAVSA